MNFLFRLLLVILAAPVVALGADSPPDGSKEIVRSFYGLVFNDHQPALAMEKFVGPKYIQHNPFVADGKQPFIDYFEKFFREHPHAHAEIKRLIAEGNLVVAHVHSTVDEHDRGRAVMDIFRIENGKIVEHWDVAQPVPEKTANSNGMF
ncbi:MAG: nuclear transport factor 2 family protein [Bdellovibrionota bacterium]